MSIRMHICNKYEVEYGFTIGVNKDVLLQWLNENNVQVYGADSDEWEIDKHDLANIPPSAYKNLTSVFRGVGYVEIDKDELRGLVRELIDSKASEDYVYVHWF